MIILIRKRHVAYVVLLGCFVAGLSAVLWHGNAAFTAAFAPGEEGASPVVVVDAGHGGEDGGAVAADGTVESGLNLAIARRVRDLLTFAGVPTTVTREGDAAIYDPGSATLREKKVSDLHNRVALVNELPGAVLLSIHQNSLPSSPSTRGAQVFWNRQEGSEDGDCSFIKDGNEFNEWKCDLFKVLGIKFKRVYLEDKLDNRLFYKYLGIPLLINPIEMEKNIDDWKKIYVKYSPVEDSEEIEEIINSIKRGKLAVK